MRMRLFAGAALAAVISGPALAQPMWAPPTWEPGMWTGPYVGADIGAAWSQNNVHESTVVFTPTMTGSKINNAVEPIGGGILGYNWEFPNHLLLKPRATSRDPASTAPPVA